uniref:Uncharacterized protein n=1 Tax=Avena sativa TaxID=4498 RepID=A0ACD5TYX7_AVESA
MRDANQVPHIPQHTSRARSIFRYCPSLPNHCVDRPTMSSSDVATAAGCEKTSWPEVVGLTIKEAEAIILKDKPDANIVPVPVGSSVITDFQPNRVFIFIDTVAEIPRVG